MPNSLIDCPEELVSLAVPVVSDWSHVLVSDLFTITNGSSQKFLFFDVPKDWRESNFKDSLLAIMELSEAFLKCDSLIVSVSKDYSDAALILHSLMYVGFKVIQPVSLNLTSNLALENYYLSISLK